MDEFGSKQNSSICCELFYTTTVIHLLEIKVCANLPFFLFSGIRMPDMKTEATPSYYGLKGSALGQFWTSFESYHSFLFVWPWRSHMIILSNCFFPSDFRTHTSGDLFHNSVQKLRSAMCFLWGGGCSWEWGNTFSTRMCFVLMLPLRSWVSLG